MSAVGIQKTKEDTIQKQGNKKEIEEHQKTNDIAKKSTVSKIK